MQVKYWVSNQNEYPFWTDDGVCTKVLEAICAETGCAAEKVESYDGEPVDAARAVELLNSGAIDIAFGIPGSMGAGLSVVEYEDTLAALILTDSPMIPYENVESCYWAVENELTAVIEETILGGHTIDVNTQAELTAQLESGSVYGILVPRSSIEYGLFVEGKLEYKEYEGIKIPYNKCICVSNSQSAGIYEQGIISRDEIADLIAETVAEAGEESEGTDRLAVYTNELAEVKGGFTAAKTVAVAGCALALFLAVLCAVLASKLKKIKTREKAKLGAVMGGEDNKEMFELDLKTKKLVAYDGFRIFGGDNVIAQTAKEKNTDTFSLAQLDEMTGFGFTEHYAGVSPRGNTIYHNRMIIHVGGRKIYITEEGRRVGGTLVLVMTNVTDDIG